MLIFLSIAMTSLTAFQGREVPSIQEEKTAMVPKDYSMVQIDQKKKCKKCRP